MNKLLSIHIPTYDRPLPLKRLLESVIPQAEKYSVPIYISDDSTNNDTKHLVSNLNYKYLSYTKTGRRLSRNFINTMKQSKTKFCWAIGDDDIALPGSINIMLNIIRSKPELQFILANAIYNDKLHTKYIKINNDLYFTDCVEFFSSFYNKMHFSTPIVNTNLFKDCDTDKYLKTFHLFTGGIWEYLAKYYNKYGQNNILVTNTPMVFLDGKEEKTWQTHFMYVKYHDRFLWLNLLPEIYQNRAEIIYKKILRERKKTKDLLQHRILKQLKTSEVDKLFYYFPARTKIVAKLISKTPIFIIKFIIKLNKFTQYIEFLLKKILKKLKLFNSVKKIYLKLIKI